MRNSSWRFLFLFSISSMLFFACKSTEEKAQDLAKSYCSSCHLFPDPSLLDKQTWRKSVLPRMAFHMGFSDFEMMSEIPEQDLMTVLKSLPARPMVKDDEWNLITNYYVSHAPDSLVIEETEIPDTISQFGIKPLDLLPEQLVTLVKIDTSNQSVYVGNRLSRLYKLNSDLTITDTVFLFSPPSWINADGEEIIASTMGIMDPNDQAKGQIIPIHNISHPILDSLKRPVYFDRSDFNQDTRIDYVVCSFGNFTGDLSVYEGLAKGYNKHVLSQLPGARKTIVKDFNNDTMPDILALIAQGDEQIVLFVNDGNFKFRKKTILRFPPVYGTTYFEIGDFNNDGFFDILTVNGDNADYSLIVKPYHGLRIFENDGENNFKEAWFFPMPGASMAMSEDFDRDGDLDIVAISFFPDFEKAPGKSLVYLQHESGAYKFTPQKTNLANKARWLVMEKGDYDRDGDCDVIIGAMNFQGLGASKADYQSWIANRISLLVLKNTLVED